jgi:hypothetical protein
LRKRPRNNPNVSITKHNNLKVAITIHNAAVAELGRMHRAHICALGLMKRWPGQMDTDDWRVRNGRYA